MFTMQAAILGKPDSYSESHKILSGMLFQSRAIERKANQEISRAQLKGINLQVIYPKISRDKIDFQLCLIFYRFLKFLVH